MLTKIQRTLLNMLTKGDKIRLRYSPAGFYFEGTSSAGAELDISGRFGKRSLTANTLNALAKKGYLDYNDAALGSWTRTAKEIE